MFDEISNIPSGDNPEFTLEDFYEIYPQFGLNTETKQYNIPQKVASMYLGLAHSCIKKKRWHGQWKIGMCLYMAHFCTLYLRQIANPTDDVSVINNAGKTSGIETSMSADGISISMDYSITTNLFKSAGTFNLTSYGQQLLTMAKLIGKGCMFVL